MGVEEKRAVLLVEIDFGVDRETSRELDLRCAAASSIAPI